MKTKKEETLCHMARTYSEIKLYKTHLLWAAL